MVGSVGVPSLNAGAVQYSIRVNFPTGSFASIPFVSISLNAVRLSAAISARTGEYFEFAVANWTGTNQAASQLSYMATGNL